MFDDRLGGGGGEGKKTFDKPEAFLENVCTSYRLATIAMGEHYEIGS